MGTSRHEVSGWREAGDHPAGRAITSPGTPDIGEARCHPRHLLPLVRSLPERRPGSSGRPIAPAKAGVERIPDSVRDQIVQLALNEPDLSPRELATRFTDT